MVVDNKEGGLIKEPWLLVTDSEVSAAQVIGPYGRRMQIEESFRDTKSVR